VEVAQYAIITGSVLNVRSVEVAQYANTTGSALNARSVEEVQYANIAGGAFIARSVEGTEYANTTSGAIIVRSAPPNQNVIQASLRKQQRKSESELQNDESHHPRHFALPPPPSPEAPTQKNGQPA
jgi:hypothetical protein